MITLIRTDRGQFANRFRRWASPVRDFTSSNLILTHNARIGVVGGGPAGSFFSYFFLSMAQRIGLDVRLDIIERRDFSIPGPSGCNMCGGIISESLVQTLAVEGINLPPTVVERGIDSYVMHFDEGKVPINPPSREKRIAAVHRGAGPKGIMERRWESFDNYLLGLAKSKGANAVQDTFDAITLEEGRPKVRTKSGRTETYDLLVIATGINTPTLRLFDQLPLKYEPPRTSKTYIAEFYLGHEKVEGCLGNSMHVFLLHIPRLEFGALIPKGDYVTICLLGREIDEALVRAFIETAEVRHCLPSDWKLQEDFCHCNPKINVRSATRPFGNRIVFIGDCATSRLYKDGIGAAYRTAKAAATTAVFHGVSEASFKRYFLPICKRIERDNRIGKLIFLITSQVQRNAHDRRGMLRMVSKEQRNGNVPHMSAVLWDTFTGSAPYKDIFLRSLHPAFLLNLGWEVLVGCFSFDKSKYQ